MVVGDHPGVALTSAIISAARDGEQMKCIAAERSYSVLARSFGVSRTLGVRYRKLSQCR